ncbi:GntR family transcriptional regulator [Streptomyces populi]
MGIDPDAEIDHGAPLTPYRQLAEILTARIMRGDWAPGRGIPSESQLVQEYGLARSTVRRAIAVLVEDGRVFTVPQRGTFVATGEPADGTDQGGA